MRIVTNPGSNLDPDLVHTVGIDLTPQQIVVDGVEHDTRVPISLRQIDGWIADARAHPYVLGTSAAEFVRLFDGIGRDDPEIIAVMTSRKLIPSHDAAVSAARTMANHTKRPLQVHVVDTGVTDLGAGLVALLAGLGRNAGLSAQRLVPILERFSAEMTLSMHIATMQNLVRSGRASSVRGWLANVMQLRPILTMEDGEIAVAETLSTRADPVDRIVARIVDRLGGRRVWAGVVHGDDPGLGGRLADALRERMAPEVLIVRPVSPSTYVHVGRSAVGCFVGPIDTLGWEPPLPDLR